MITNLSNFAYGTPGSLYIQAFSDRPMRERAYITFLAKSLLSREPDLLIYHLRPNQLEHFQRAFPAIKFSTDGLLALLPYPWRSGPAPATPCWAKMEKSPSSYL